MATEVMNLSWNEFQSSTGKAFQSLQGDEHFSDVTLACNNGEQMKVHKVILSSCSQFFKKILIQNPHQHPLLYLKDVQMEDLRSLIKFMYSGQVEVCQANLAQFLQTASDLQVQGLLGNGRFPGPSSREGKEDGSHNEAPQLPANNPELEARPSPGTSPFAQLYEFKQELESNPSVEAEPSKHEPDDLVPDFGFQDVEIEEKLDALTERKEGVWVCLECGKTDKLRFHMRRHAETHLEGVSHKCPGCEKVFKTRSQVKQHFNTQHREDRPFLGTDSSWGRAGLEGNPGLAALQQAGMQAPSVIRYDMQPPVPQEPSLTYACDQCGKIAPTKNALRVHKYRNHTVS